MIIKLLTNKKMVKAQSALELVIVFALASVALLVMSGYFKRGLSGKYKNAADSQLEGQFDPANGNAYYASNDSGDSESIERNEEVISNDSFGACNTATDFAMTYQVAGPLKDDITDKDGNVIIANDTNSGSSRRPLNTTTVSHFEADWQNLTAQ